MWQTMRRYVMESPIWLASAAVLAITVIVFWIIFPREPSIIQDASSFGRRALGDDPDRWQNFINAYQTLIGGALAVFAALLTMAAMMVVDRKQARRHTEMMDLNLRVDRMRLERLLVPQLAKLREQFGALTDIQRAEKLGDAPLGLSFKRDTPRAMGESFINLLERAAKLFRVCGAIADCIGRPAWKAAEDLFDGRLTDACSVMRSNLDTAFDQLDRTNNLIRYIHDLESRSASPDPTDDEAILTRDHRVGLRNLLLETDHTFATLTSDLDLVTKQLRRLAATYRIELNSHWLTPSPDQL